jgi:uncharacterized protein
MSNRCCDPPPAGLRQGIEMYNRGEFYECHEVLEDAWRAEPDEVRRLYQGVLQIGVAFHHLGSGNWRGAVGLLSRGIRNVKPFRPRCMGIDTEVLIRDAQRCLDSLQQLGSDHADRFDWSMVPVISLDPANDDVPGTR